ncbi:HNH endonuclease [Rhodococcus sp. MTM3W5.2]|uniref:HNH endonuclease n=1 Tax=Rhodococcus sp. MTM3W5.2 TaxID=1805827 RepID=UPI0021D52764|nr:HNH endonuclease [Rhodococcus sp. MTM3W5.2]
MTAVHHIHDWSKSGTTDIGVLTLGCDGCHALIHDGPGGWKPAPHPKAPNTPDAPNGSHHRTSTPAKTPHQPPPPPERAPRPSPTKAQGRR